MKKKLINTILILTFAAMMCACGATKEVSVDQTSIKSAAKAIGGKSASVNTVTADGTQQLTLYQLLCQLMLHKLQA